MKELEKFLDEYGLSWEEKKIKGEDEFKNSLRYQMRKYVNGELSQSEWDSFLDKIIEPLFEYDGAVLIIEDERVFLSKFELAENPYAEGMPVPFKKCFKLGKWRGSKEIELRFWGRMGLGSYLSEDEEERKKEIAYYQSFFSDEVRLKMVFEPLVLIKINETEAMFRLGATNS